MKKNIFIKKNFVFSTLISLFLLTGCVSKPIPIPGENRIIIKNIYIEYSNIADKYFELEDYKNAVKYYELSMEDKNLYWQSYYKP